MHKYFFPFLLLFLTSPLAAQDEPMAEDGGDNLQATFIDGTREKLLGNWDKALEKFKEVLEKDRTNATAAYEMARVYEAKKDLENAEKFAAKSVEWDGANEWFRIYYAEVLQKNNKDNAAAAQYAELVKQQPFNEEFYQKWAYYLVRASQPEAAIQAYNELESKVGIHEESIRHKHTLYMGMGNTTLAAAELEKLIAKFPRNASYWHLLATFYEQVGEKAKAKGVYQKILEISPEDARAVIAMAESAKGNDDVRFLNSLKPVFEDSKTDIDTKIKEIFPYISELSISADKNIGNTLLALTSVLATVHPDDAKAHSALADVLYYTGQPNKALKEYKRTLQLDDTKWTVWEQMLYIYADKKDYTNLVKESEKALDLFPNQGTAYYLNGAGYNGKGQYKEAIASLQQALLLSARNPRLRYDVLNESGKAYFHLKQYQKSDGAFEEALTINAQDPAVLKNYSHYLAARGEQLEKAKELAARLNQVSPNHPLSHEAMAFVLYKMKDFKTAKDWLDKALQAGGGDDPTILERYGDVLYQLGNINDAILHWQQALDKGGDSTTLERKVREKKMVE